MSCYPNHGKSSTHFNNYQNSGKQLLLISKNNILQEDLYLSQKLEYQGSPQKNHIQLTVQSLLNFSQKNMYYCTIVYYKNIIITLLYKYSELCGPHMPLHTRNIHYPRCRECRLLMAHSQVPPLRLHHLPGYSSLPVTDGDAVNGPTSLTQFRVSLKSHSSF